MLYTEAAGATSGSSGVNDAFTVVKFNEYVYSQIRRFVIVDVKRNFVYAWFVPLVFHSKHIR